MSDSDKITVNIPGAIIAALIYWSMPIISLIIWIKISKSEKKFFFIGVLGFITSVGLEFTIFNLVLKNIIKNEKIITILAGITPGPFEETGRLVCFLIILKYYKKKYISVTYGIGHGGFESIFFSNIILNYFFNKNYLVKNGYLKKSVVFCDYLLPVYERILAFIYQVSASVLVFKSVKEKKYLYYIFAIIIHDIIDETGALVGVSTVIRTIITEGVFTVIDILIVIFACYLYKGMSDENEENLIPESLESDEILEKENEKNENGAELPKV